MSHVLVTGGLGFVGSRLCHALLDEGCDVRCVDDLSGAYAGGVGPEAAPGLRARGAEVIVAGAAPAHLAGVDAAIHLAGVPGVLPTPEHTPVAPLNLYAASKANAEAAVLATGADAVIVRPFTVYGPGQRPEMAFARWIAALERGEPVPWHAAPGTARDFSYVDDVAAGLIAALRRGATGEAYNISGWRTVELAEALGLLAGHDHVRLRRLPCSTVEAFVTSGCGRKAAAELGYEPRVELADGLDRQLEAASSPLLAA
jgi:UDP-glucuronate 4-epimerase